MRDGPQVHHGVHPVHRLAHQLRVLEVPGEDAFGARLVDRQQIGQCHLVAGREQLPCHMAADVPGGPRDQHQHQPFTAPTRPLTKYRWRLRKSSTTGTTTISAPAIRLL
jgi:hypothetical protein